MKNTGVWTKVELDDDGDFSIKIHSASEWKPGETVTCGEDITDKVPIDVVNQLKGALNKIIRASKVSMTELSDKAANQMAEFKSGGRNKKVLTLDFAGEMKQDGKMN